MPADEDIDDEAKAGPKGKRYITRTGAERLHAELQQLLYKERPKVTAEVSAAAAQGDRSENAEYLYGKKRLREIDRRIRFLQQRLDTATIVTPAEQKKRSLAFFGATVLLEDEDGEHKRYQIVGADELDPAGGRISMDSPLGRALLGKRVDDEVTIQSPRGERSWTLVKIDYL
ncbi:MAG: transcription elongation factor GreB [Myxococcaceae bacterium]